MMHQEQDNKKVYFISGGGTGGHIYPAITIADELLREDDTQKIYYVGNPKNLEYEIVQARESIDFLPVNVSGMPRKFSFKFIRWCVDLEISIWKCIFYILKYQPDAIFTTGGYVSAPVAFAAMLLRKPFMIHDCDAHPGLVSQNVAPFAKCVSVAFESSKNMLNANNIVCNGNPIRNSFDNISKQEAREKLGLKDKFTIIGMGGSQGAMTINTALIEIAQELTEQLDVQLIIQTGKKNYKDVIKKFEEYFPNYYMNTNLIVKSYFEDMSIPLKAADLAIARAGSVSLSEISACALPSILVPYPHAAADHQRKNAKEKCENGASLCLEDSDCNKDSLIEQVKSLYYHPEKLLEMGVSSKNLARKNSTQSIIQQLKSIVG